MDINNRSSVAWPSRRYRYSQPLEKMRNLKLVSSPKVSVVWQSYSLHTGLILLSLILSNSLPHHIPSGFINQSLYPISELAELLIKWDSHWYTYIAQHGYDSQSIVFFPLIIIGIKIFSLLGLSYAMSGLLLCNLFALFSFKIMYSLFRLDFSKQISQRALYAYAIMPTSFFINSIYTESIFIFFALSCIYNARQRKWWFAGICGALATLTRNIGVFLFIYLLYEYFIISNKSERFSRSAIALLLPPAALLCYMYFNYYLTNNPLAFLHSQQGWGRYYDSPLNSFMNNIVLTFNGNPYIQPGASLDTFMMLLGFFSLLFLSLSTKFKIPSSYLIIGWIWFLIPLVSTSSWLPLYSISRFVLVVFPIYLFLAQLPNCLYYTYIILGTITLSLCTALFVNWYWVG